MKLKKAMACMLAGAMVLSMGAVLPAAASEDDNTLTVWTWDPNFNIYAINKAAEIYAKDHEGFKVEAVSYTHLDVYKRQVFERHAAETETDAKRSAEGGADAGNGGTGRTG